MTLTILLVSVVIIALLVAVLWSREPKPNPGTTLAAARPARSGTSLSESNKYHAVSIKFASSSACDAAKMMDGKRFLSSAAPRLPLPDCDVAVCKCKFLHHKDRRASEDRRSPIQAPMPGSATGTFPVNKRSGRDRRANPPTSR